MIVKKTSQIYLFFLIALFISACNNKKEVDISNIQLEVHVERFDQELGKLNSQNLSKEAPRLAKKYGAFYYDFMDGMLGAGNAHDTSYYTNLRTILATPDYKALREEVSAKYPDLNKTEEELEDAFKHIKYYYPNQKLPRLISFLSGFSVQTPIGNDYIGIGLDMFLGADSKFLSCHPTKCATLYFKKVYTGKHYSKGDGNLCQRGVIS